MNKYKVCVYAICKNEEKFVSRWVDSMNEADIIVVTDTGSTDGTVEKLRELGATVHVNKISPWRFDIARNVSLANVPDDVDICVCTDLDETFEKGWRGHLEKSWSDDTTNGNYLYNWSLKSDGSPDVQFNYFKVHSRHEYRWIYPVHECLEYIGTKPEKKVYIDGMVLNHYPDSSKSRSSYLPLLELAVKESPNDSRMSYYLGREYMYMGMWEKSIAQLERHLSLPSSTWSEERSAAMRDIAQCYRNLGDYNNAYRWYLRAIAQCPTMREPYIECAQLQYDYQNFEAVFFMVQEALKIQHKSANYINNAYAWNENPYDLAALACFKLGMHERSLEYAKTALEYSPNNKRLQENVDTIKKVLDSDIKPTLYN